MHAGRSGGVDEALLHPAEHHAPRHRHELGLAFVGNELIHLDRTALVGRRDTQVRDPLVAGDRDDVKRRSAGLRFVATDIDWSAGDGPEVRGPTMSLILGMVGRRAALDDLDGPGLDTLRSRC